MYGRLAMLFIVILIALIGCLCSLTYPIGFLKGFNKCKDIDDELINKLTRG